MEYPREHPDFVTITCLEWQPVLDEDNFKEIIVDSLRFLSRENRIRVYAFVIMNNHFHLIWQMQGEHTRENVQRDFLKFTGQQILKHLRNNQSEIMDSLLVSARDRRYQVWERNSLSIPLHSEKVFKQKLDYIHRNPVKAGLCDCPEDYRYSSARFYYKNERSYDFLFLLPGCDLFYLCFHGVLCFFITFYFMQASCQKLNTCKKYILE